LTKIVGVGHPNLASPQLGSLSCVTKTSKAHNSILYGLRRLNKAFQLTHDRKHFQTGSAYKIRDIIMVTEHAITDN